MIELRPLGDRAFLARFATEPEAQGWAEAVRALAIPGVVDFAVAYASAAVFLDPDRIEPAELEGKLGGAAATGGPRAVGRLSESRSSTTARTCRRSPGSSAWRNPRS